MPVALAPYGLDDRQRKLVLAIIDGTPLSVAYRVAGYATVGAANYAVGLPAVRQALHAEMLARLQCDDGPAARWVLRKIMDDEGAPAKLRIECAKTLLDRGGYIAPKAIEATDHGAKAPSEMTAAELHEHVARLQSELAMRARPVVDGAVNPPDDAPDDAQLADLLR